MFQNAIQDVTCKTSERFYFLLNLKMNCFRLAVSNVNSIFSGGSFCGAIGVRDIIN